MTSVADLSTETVQFPSDTFTIKSFLARPARAEGARDARPAVLVIQEWWGLTEHIKDIAQRLAREGFVALAPDLYSRLPGPPGATAGAGGFRVTKDPQEAAKLMESLSSQAALRDLNAAVGFLKTQSFVDGTRIGAVGFCMGGTFALMMATHNSEIKAAVPFYGKVPPIETFRFLLCPVLYHYGAKDAWVTRREVDILKDGLVKYGKPGEVVIYPDANHAFFNDTRPEVHRADDARRAWERTLAFLRQQLG